MASVAELTNEKNKLQGELALYARNAQLAKEDGDVNAALKWDRLKLATQQQINSIDASLLENANTPVSPINQALNQSNQTYSFRFNLLIHSNGRLKNQE